MSACEQMDARVEQYNTTFHATRAFVRVALFRPDTNALSMLRPQVPIWDRRLRVRCSELVLGHHQPVPVPAPSLRKPALTVSCHYSVQPWSRSVGSVQDPCTSRQALLPRAPLGGPARGDGVEGACLKDGWEYKRNLPLVLWNRCCDTEKHPHPSTYDRTTDAHADTQTRRHADTQTRRHADTQTHRHTDTQTHRHTDTHTDTHRHTQTHTDTHRHTHRHTDTDTHTDTDRHAHRHTERHTERDTDTQTHRHTERDTDTHKGAVHGATPCTPSFLSASSRSKYF